ncbi:alpha 1,2-mannosyltransferase [Nannochloropsis gaditana CCMP526]|uniref:alpha 1,2-mannosyltransferase n=1 Tax=Nannochloropsis gaditana (strain CCMP526) TaxID=1093141 RepID=UPI00029F5CE7|nr:alpha 1,2-mannosyltransferase [Nannochloropsis gaditana CCMP526]EKU20156.1 alpha 1,2-mannosyltransferase [Nannochloropsis gaditana CCMP526]|eukprot:XP_005856206.1 alpha 1,2-mannosyltransferase [Nannochloropsis gaditana CCMP526]
MDRAAIHATSRARRWHYLLPGLFGCLLLGISLTPTPFYQRGMGSSDRGVGIKKSTDDFWLRAKLTQPSQEALVSHTGKIAEKDDSSSLLLYFAEARKEGQLSASAFGEVERLLQQHEQQYKPTQKDATLSHPSWPLSGASGGEKSRDVALQDKIYWKGRERREAELAKLHHNYSAIKPFDGWGPIYIWDWFNPDYVCSSMERVGRVGDGGKWMCDLATLRARAVEAHRPCIVYAFGINDDTSFEEELVNRTGCQVFAFDPTVKDLPASAANVTPALQFYKQALGPRDGPSRNFLMERNLLSIMKELGHTYVDVLKVDVEGAEWASFAPVFGAGPLPVGQLLIELHYKDVATTFDFFTNLEGAGFRAFSRETNYHPCVTGKMPVAIEYSFVHPYTYPTGDPTPASKAMLARQPDYEPKNGVIYMLTQQARVHTHLLGMLEGLDKHFNAAPGRGYPVLIFHDDFTPEDEALVRASTTSNVSFYRVSFQVPAFLDKERIPERTECSKHSSTLGYRHMCRFLGLQVQHLLQDFEWHWRLDDDSVFLAPIGYDPFRMMAENGKRYGFNRILHDNADCVVGLWDVAKEFARSRGLSPTFLDNWDAGVTFYNNFEISHRSIWTDPVVQDFMDHIDALGGIYYVRWGDAPIRSLAVAMVVPETEVHFFSDVGYAHLPYHRHEPRALPSPLEGALWHLDGAHEYIRGVEEDQQVKKARTMVRRRQHGVVVILSTRERFDYLKRCLASFEKHFNQHHGYHVWIWSHGLSYDQRLELRALSSAPIRIDLLDQPLNLTAPTSATEAARTPCGPRDAHSSRLRGWEVSRVIAKRYFWQWRLADDAVFTEDLVEDPFLRMARNKATYGVAAVRPVPLSAGACVGRLVEEATRGLGLEGEAVAEVRDMVESVYFDPSFEVSHQSVWTDSKWNALIEVLETSGLAVDGDGESPTSFLGNVDDAFLRSLGVTLHLQGGMGAFHIFDDLHPVDLSASLLPWSEPPSHPTQESHIRVGEHRVTVSQDSHSLTALFRPRHLGFLDAELGPPVPIPRHVSSSDATRSGEPDTDLDIAWILGKTRIGHLNNTKPEAAFELDDAVAMLSAAEGDADFFWRHTGSQRAPNAIFNDGTLGTHQALVPSAGLAVVPEDHPDEVRLVVLCQIRNVSGNVYEGQRTQLGSAIAVVSNAHQRPELWEYDMRRIPGTHTWSGWHTALTLVDGSSVSRRPSTDYVYILGERAANITTQDSSYIKREHLVGKLPVSSLLAMSMEAMEFFVGRAPGDTSRETNGSKGQWASFAEHFLPAHGQVEAGMPSVEALFPSADGKATALAAESVGMGYLPGPNLWFVGDIVPPAQGRRGLGKRLVLKTAEAVTGPWEDHSVVELPLDYSRRQYVCPSLYVLPSYSRDRAWEAAIGLACSIKGHGVRPVIGGRSTSTVQVGPTMVNVFRLGFQALSDTEVDAIPTR